MIKKLARRFLIMAGLVFIAVGILALAFKIALPPEKVKKLAADGIRGYLIRERT